MNALEITVIIAIIGVAIFFMARRTIRKYKGAGGGCGSKRKGKNVSLTIGGEPVKRK